MANADINRINREFWDTRIDRENQSRIDRIKAHCRATGVKYDPGKAAQVWRNHPFNPGQVRPY